MIRISLFKRSRATRMMLLEGMRTYKKQGQPLKPFGDRPTEANKVLLAAQELGISANELAAALGVAYSTVYQYASRGNANPTPEKIRAFQELYCPWVPLGWFFDGKTSPFPKKVTDDLRELRPMDMGRIPVIGSANAGSPASENADLSWLEVPIQMVRPHYWAWLVKGDSMMPFLHELDTISVDPHTQPRIGDLALWRQMDDSGSYVVKQLKHDGEKYVLRSLNRSYPDQPLDGFIAEGVVVGFWRASGGEYLMRYNPRGIRPSD